MGQEPNRVTLRPVPAALQRFAIYETKTKLYIVGSTNDGTSCRLLKIDRAHPTMLEAPLVEDDDAEYSDAQIKEVLLMLDDGNKSTANKGQGLVQVASAFGIVGLVRFLEGYYLILITKRKLVANIGGHMIYKIEDTSLYPISNPSSNPAPHPCESKYLKIFQNVDLSSNFYFSYSYDLTLSLQCQMRSNPNHTPSCTKFIWNEHLLQDLKGRVNDRWILHITHGFIGQYNISVFGRPIYMTLIGRRSKEFAGTRFLKRGSNDEGHVANEVETEQVVHDASTTIHDSGRYTSFLQLRGSVPSFWSQDLSQVIKPGIIIDRASPFSTPAALHFASCFKRFGAPITCLNLVKKREKHPRESLLSVELEASIAYLNQFLPPEHHIRYIHKDMHHINRKKSVNLIEILEKVVDDCIKATGFFHNGPELYCHKLQPNPDYKAVGGYGYRNGYVGRDQTGILRVNCVDCLDRTNAAQFIAGKCALGYQLYALGLLSEPKLPFDCDAVRILEEGYEDLGDTLAIQYGGSQLVHRVQTYRKIAPMANQGRDLLQTIQRYYRNAFTDTDKQMAINVFLGVFKPKEGTTDIWDLPTDYYLHHTLARVPPVPSDLSHTKWWTESLLRALPLPHCQARTESQSASPQTHLTPLNNKINTYSFDEVYKTCELTDFDSTLSRNLLRTIENNESPFVVKEKQPKLKKKVNHVRVAIVGSPVPNGEDTGSSEEVSSDEETPSHQMFDSGQSLGTSETMPNPTEVTTMEAYGFELKDPKKEDMVLYEGYATLYSHMLASVPSLCELTPQAAKDELAKWEPKHLYKGSVFSIEPPIVSLKDEAIYEEAARVAQTGVVLSPGKESMDLYTTYVRGYLI